MMLHHYDPQGEDCWRRTCRCPNRVRPK
jgi:hypothetical protein